MNIDKRLRAAGLTVALGLCVQLLSLLPLHPLAFIVFVGAGVPIVAVGVILYLLAMVSQANTPAGNVIDE